MAEVTTDLHPVTIEFFNSHRFHYNQRNPAYAVLSLMIVLIFLLLPLLRCWTTALHMILSLAIETSVISANILVHYLHPCPFDEQCLAQFSSPLKLSFLSFYLSAACIVINVRYALELHMVHESADRKLAVVGILYQLGRPSRFLAQMASYIKKLTDLEESAEEKVGLVNPWSVRWGSRKYYRYMGSLTTPPCTEGVTWTIIKKVRTVSRDQVKLLREAVHDEFEENARPTQPTNQRDVYIYRPKSSLH